jgi:hypothetical protein
MSMQPEENPLESALRLAANDPSHRPAFFAELLSSTVFIIGSSEGSHTSRTLEAGEKVSIQSWQKTDGTPVIPFFSSLGTLRKAINEESNYLSLPARALFDLTRGATLMLNPKSDYGKEFFPQEIEALLVEGVNRVPEQRVTKKATQVLLGQPANYPNEMLNSLTSYFTKKSKVKAAYLALMHDPAVSEKPSLVIGISTEGNADQIVKEAGVVAGDSAPPGEAVDIMVVTEGETGLSEYFRKSVTPFYERTWGGRLKAFLGVGHA